MLRVRSALRKLSRAEPQLPSHAKCIVIGGGVIGSSVAYHLARHPAFRSSEGDGAGASSPDVLLLERDQVTSGTTWHAAGLCVTYGSLSETSTRLRQYSRELYSEVLEAETGQATGFQPVGFIEVAADRGRLDEYRRVAAFNRHMGVDVREITAAEVLDLFPLAKVDDVLAGFYVPDDGRVNPVDVTQALAKGARLAGARVAEGVAVASVEDRVAFGARHGSASAALSGAAGGGFEPRREVTAVVTEGGQRITCDYVVNCGGMWARQLAEKSGVAVPNQAAEHYYLVTGDMPEVDPKWPVLEDPGSYTYIRPEGGGLMVGLFETRAAAWNVGEVPRDFSFGEIEPDWERMTPFLERAMARVPASESAGLKKFFCGPESFTPDLAPLIGEAPEVRNYFVAAGLNSIGILTGGGVGRLVAEWVATGRPDMDVTGINIDRMQRYQANPEYRASRVVESLGLVYQCHFPYKVPRTARNAKRTALHDRLAARNAHFVPVTGFESPSWYARPGESAEVRDHSFGRPSFFDNWREEHLACRERAALFDMSFMARFVVRGPDAARALDQLCTSWVSRGGPGKIHYTQILNDSGKIEADVTVMHLNSDLTAAARTEAAAGGDGDGAWPASSFMVVATDTAHGHVLALLRRHLSEGGYCASVADVTGAYAQINIQGPLSRDIMRAATSDDGLGSVNGLGSDSGTCEAAFSDARFPFLSVRDVSVGLGRALCARITYVGELGYELHVPSEFAVPVYDAITAAGEPLGLAHAGLSALGSLRLEKGYRDYGHDIDNTDSVLEAGLGFTVARDKPLPFSGSAAVEAERSLASGKMFNLPQRMVSVRVDDPLPMLFGGEVLWRSGTRVGDIRSGSYGHSVGGAVGLSMVSRGGGGGGGDVRIDKRWLEEGEWEVEIGNRRYPATVSFAPLYDPSNSKIKA